MAKGQNQRLKLYYLAKILLEKTDDTHYITMPEIIRELEEYEVTAERKSLYSDMKELENFGIEIEGEPDGKSYHYHVAGRMFELPELKLLVDSIQASRFITARKTNALIGKLEKLVSEHEAKQLQRQVYVSGRIKTMNESIYYNVDAIHNAITQNRKIRFQYFQWNEKKEMVLRHEGAYYHISPWGLSWDNENYYLIGYDSDSCKIKHYRVDKMLHIGLSQEAREGKEVAGRLDMAVYTRQSFSMMGGDTQTVRLLAKNSMAGVLIDRFGKDIMMVPAGDGYFSTHVDVQVSPQFIHWVFSLGQDVKIAGPESVVEKARAEIRRLTEQYE